MRLLVLSEPPIVIDHPKAVQIKTRYLNGENLEDLQDEYGFAVLFEKTSILIKEEENV